MHRDDTVPEDAFTRAGLEVWLFAEPKHRAEKIEYATPEWAVRGLRVFV